MSTVHPTTMPVSIFVILDDVVILESFYLNFTIAVHIKNWILFLECDSYNQSRCETSTTANNCEKIKGVDTCICGRDSECDPVGLRPKCVNSYGVSRQQDLSLSCKEGR